MFQTIFNKEHAIALREHGFSASEISEFLGCSKDWVYGVVKTKTNTHSRNTLMQYVIDTYDDDSQNNSNILTCKECGLDFTQDNDYSSDDFCSDVCHARHVLDDETFKEIYG